MPKKTLKLRKSDSKRVDKKSSAKKRMFKSALSQQIPKGSVKTASELGIKADSLGIIKAKAKTHKGRKIMEKREPQLIEGPKKSIFMRGKKVSQKVLDLMKDLHHQRGNDDVSKLFLRTSQEVHPFDDVGPIEKMADKQQSALFVCGTHQKKRPDNLIFGRLFASHILDMFEFGVTEYEPVQSFKPVDVNSMIKPVLVFQGEQFDFVTKHRRFKNYLIDFFKLADYDEANIAELKRVMVFTALGESKITFKQFEVNPGVEVNQTDVKNQTLKMNEIGPRFTLHWRRDKLGSEDLFKDACK